MKTILSLDGGGSRGLFTATVLQELQNLIGTPIHEAVDLIVGTSIGGLIGTFVGQHHCRDPMDQMQSLFNETSVKTIFNKSFADCVLGRLQTEPVYESEGKRKVIQAHVHERLFKNLAIPTAVVTYNCSKGQSSIFKSWDCDPTLTTVDACDATCAAPVYFAPVQIGGNLYIDGGLSANNPCMVAITLGRELFPLDDFRVLSIGTGESHVKMANPEPSTFDWLRKMTLMDMMFCAGSSIQTELARDALGSKFLRLDSEEISNVPMDCTDSDVLRTLETAGRGAVNRHAEILKQFFQ